MANTEFAHADPETVNHWAAWLFRESLKPTVVFKLLGTNKRSAIIQRVTELEKLAGDTVKYDLLMQTEGAGVTGNSRLRDNEVALVYHQDTIVIDQLRQGHSFDRMSQQRTVHDLRSDARDNLSDWWSDKLDSYWFRYAGGDTSISHGQTGVAPDTDHYVVCGDVTHSGTIATDEASLGNNDQIDLMDIDYAKEKAMTITPAMRPGKFDGEEMFVVVLHEYSATDIRVSTNTNATIKWSTIQQYANVRGLKNPVFLGAEGVYNNAIILKSTRVYSPRSNVRRNLFLGAGAGVFAVGNAYDKIDQKKFGPNNLMSWAEQSDDYGNEKGVAAGMIFGLKASRFNSKNHGAMVMTAYAASHG